MSELRYRHSAEMTAPAPTERQRAEVPDRHHRLAAERAVPDARPTRPESHHDPDAEFKRPVPKPAGYLPDDTGGRTSSSAAVRDRAERILGTGWPDSPSELSRPYRPDGWTIATREDADATSQAAADRVVDGDELEPLRAVVDRPHFYDPLDEGRPHGYGDPLARQDGTRVPCFDGPPRREQTRQGWPGDCGVIAALGAVAGCQPEQLTSRIRALEDGSFRVTLSEAKGAAGGVSEPTGRDIELTVTPELPVSRAEPGVPACAKAEDGASWCAVAEKALAGVDQIWSPEQRAKWAGEWAGLCAKDEADGVARPRSGPEPTGYVRLHQGTTPWERAELLTQLTGQTAVVRKFPTGRDEWTINRTLRAQLSEDKPVLVNSRSLRPQEDVLPHGLEDGHVYEVTGIEKGKIILRNPWNKDHPEPMESDEFARNMGSFYTTLM